MRCAPLRDRYSCLNLCFLYTQRDLDSENESEGSMKDFIDDEDTAESTPASSDSESDVQSVHDDSSRDAKSSGDSTSNKRKATVGTRSTRNNPNFNGNLLYRSSLPFRLFYSCFYFFPKAAMMTM